MKTKIVKKTQRNDPPTRTEVIYVNKDGVECGFFAKSTTEK
jgi:hypothetical protein